MKTINVCEIEDIEKLESVSRNLKKDVIKNAIVSGILAIIGLISLSIGTSFGVKGIHEEVAMGMIVAGSLIGIPVAIFGDRAEMISRKREGVKDKIRKLTPVSKDEHYII